LTDLKIYLLGTIRLERAGQSVEFDTRKADALLAYLGLPEASSGRLLPPCYGPKTIH
jgi:DNA-binding SARP family transcriptional activator